MKIILNSIRENRKKKQEIYYESHHILPESLFPLWKNKKSNLVLLTAREHYFCHQLLSKIFPSDEMTTVLWFFMIGRKSNNKTSKQRKIRYTSKEYERLKIKFSKISSKRLKNILNNLSEEEWNIRNNKSIMTRRKNYDLSKLAQQSFLTLKKNGNYKQWQELQSKATKKRWQDPKQAKEMLKGLHTKETVEKMAKTCTGLLFFNNGKIQIRARECPAGFVKGKLRPKIICIETGEIKTFQEWKELGYGKVTDVCLGNRKHCKGMTFKYEECSNELRTKGCRKN